MPARKPSPPKDVEKTRIAVVDDHPIMCEAIAVSIASQSEYEVVARGSCAEEAISIAANHAPDLMVIDLNMPGSGLNAIEHISAANPDVKLFVLTAYDDYHNVTEALRAGAAGYTLKGISGEEMLEQVKKVLNNEAVLPSELAIRLLKEVPTERRDPDSEVAVTDDDEPSERDCQILDLIATGKSNREISTVLGVAESTVKKHVSQLLDKLGAKNRVEAAMIWLASGR
jgi:DNA-binding NarL/FixJ family response regulator